MSNVREILEQIRSELRDHVQNGWKFTLDAEEGAVVLAALDAEGVGPHVEAVTQAVRDDEGYAVSWHANIAMAYQDEGGDHATANRAAARFMQQLFGVDTSSVVPADDENPVGDAHRLIAEVDAQCDEIEQTLRADEEQSDGQ